MKGRRACVLVVGDAGHSPRILLHTRSLLQSAGYNGVDFIGDLKTGSKLPVDLATDPRIDWHHLPGNLPGWTARVLPNYYSLRAAVKAIYQFMYLLWLLMLRIPAPDVLLLQTPPAIPTLLCARLACGCWLTTTKLIIDWHNFAYTLMAMDSAGKPLTRSRQLLVSLAKRLERWWGGRADVHLCVTRAMAEFLRSEWQVSGDIRVLYDRPPPTFHRLSAVEMHEFLATIEWPAAVSDKFGPFSDSCTLLTEKVARSITTRHGRSVAITMRPERPAVIISSTSWTADEDMSPLLHAIKECEQMIGRGQLGGWRYILFIITGKGPLRGDFERKVARLDLRHVSVQTMWLLIEDYPRLLGCADLGICMHSSSSGLDLPMKVVDMFGCGLPVCAVDYDCITELVRPGKTGLLFRTGKELATHIKKLFMDDRLLDQMRREIVSEFENDSNRWEANWIKVFD